MPTTQLRNDRDAIIAIVAEHVIFDDKYLRKAKIKLLTDQPKGLKSVQHNSNWTFAYDSRANVIYIAGDSV